MKTLLAILALGVVYSQVYADVTSCISAAKSNLAACNQACDGVDIMDKCFGNIDGQQVDCFAKTICDASPSASGGNFGGHYGSRGPFGSSNECQTTCHDAGITSMQSCIDDPSNNCASAGSDVKSIVRAVKSQVMQCAGGFTQEKCICVLEAKGMSNAQFKCQFIGQRFGGRKKREIEAKIMDLEF